MDYQNIKDLTEPQRFMLFLDEMNITERKVCLKAGLSNGLVGKAVRAGRFSKSLRAKLLKAYPQINRYWLATGNGEMLIREQEPAMYSKNENIEALPKIGKDLDDEKVYAELIETYKNEITQLHVALQEAQKQISHLVETVNALVARLPADVPKK